MSQYERSMSNTTAGCEMIPRFSIIAKLLTPRLAMLIIGRIARHFVGLEARLFEGLFCCCSLYYFARCIVERIV